MAAITTTFFCEWYDEAGHTWEVLHEFNYLFRALDWFEGKLKQGDPHFLRVIECNKIDEQTTYNRILLACYNKHVYLRYIADHDPDKLVLPHPHMPFAPPFNP